MAQEDQALIRSVIRSFDKKIDWDATPASEGGVRVTLKMQMGQASTDLSRDELDGAHDGALSWNQLRERLKRTRKRIRDAQTPYMPWRLPKIEPIGAPGPRGGGWSGGRR